MTIEVEAVTEPFTLADMRRAFPDARWVCECPSRRGEDCTSDCVRFGAARDGMRRWFGEVGR